MSVVFCFNRSPKGVKPQFQVRKVQIPLIWGIKPIIWELNFLGEGLRK